MAEPFMIPGTLGVGGELRLYEDPANGSHYVGLKAPSALAADKIYILPSADGSNGQVLKTNGSGAMSWGWVDWSEVINKPSTFTPSAHTHAAEDISSGVLGFARGGTNNSAFASNLFIYSDGTKLVDTGNVQWHSGQSGIRFGGTGAPIVSGNGCVSDSGVARFFWDNTGIRFFGFGTVAQAAALTQNYSTVDRTLSSYTADVENTAYTGINNVQTNEVYAKVADLNALRVAVENLRALAEDATQFLNALVDDMQGYGLET